jgi:hypothetical protein
MERIEVVNDMVYRVTYDDDTLKELSRSITGATIGLRLSFGGELVVGVATEVEVAFVDHLGAPLDIEAQVAVVVTGNNVGEMFLDVHGGKGVFDFVANAAGSCELAVTWVSPTQQYVPAKMEVTVGE